MSRFMMTCGLAVLLIGLPACGSKQTYSGPARAAVSGKVIFGGELITNGAIALIPENETSRRSGGKIQDGLYSISEPNGPNLGKYRVEIRWPKPTGAKVKDSDSGVEIDEMKEAVPARFNVNSELAIEIKPGLNEKNWELTP